MTVQRKLPSALLFVCDHNALRSPMAEALLLSSLRARGLAPSLYVTSAGLQATELDGFAAAVMAEWGLDIRNHQPKDVQTLEEDRLLDQFDTLITLSPRAHHWARSRPQSLDVHVHYWATPDPVGLSETRDHILMHYRSVRNLLQKRVDDFVASWSLNGA